jgi:hypothetical protein
MRQSGSVALAVLFLAASVSALPLCGTVNAAACYPNYDVSLVSRYQYVQHDPENPMTPAGRHKPVENFVGTHPGYGCPLATDILTGETTISSYNNGVPQIPDSSLKW